MNTEDQKNIFNMFHDGGFIFFRQAGNDIYFEVDIEYLAQMLHPDYHLFKGILKNCQRLALKLWDSEETIEDIGMINELADELEISSAAVDSDGVCIFCNRYRRLSDSRYGPLPGGYLFVRCDAIHLFDEGDRAMSTDHLGTIRQDYWHSL